MLKRSFFKNKKDFDAHNRNIETVRKAIRKKIDSDIFERVVSTVDSYKKMKHGWVVNLANGMKIKIYSQEETIAEPKVHEDVIVTINDKFFGPIYWSNCGYKSFDSQTNISANLIGYKKYILKFKKVN